MQIKVFLAALALFLFTECGYASSIGLISVSNGVYEYGLTLSPGEFVEFAPGATIRLFALADVTGASVGPLGTGSAFFPWVPTWMPTMVTFTLPMNTRETIGSSAHQVITVGDLFIDSLAPVGTVHFTMDTFNEDTVRGKVSGPSHAPEPGSILLLVGGLLCLLFVQRRRKMAV